jgi:hypothetical protein
MARNHFYKYSPGTAWSPGSAYLEDSETEFGYPFPDHRFDSSHGPSENEFGYRWVQYRNESSTDRDERYAAETAERRRSEAAKRRAEMAWSRIRSEPAP